MLPNKLFLPDDERGDFYQDLSMTINPLLILSAWPGPWDLLKQDKKLSDYSQVKVILCLSPWSVGGYWVGREEVEV